MRSPSLVTERQPERRRVVSAVRLLNARCASLVISQPPRSRLVRPVSLFNSVSSSIMLTALWSRMAREVSDFSLLASSTHLLYTFVRLKIRWQLEAAERRHVLQLCQSRQSTRGVLLTEQVHLRHALEPPQLALHITVMEGKLRGGW